MFLRWKLQGGLKAGTDALGVDLVGELVRGLRDCSAGCQVTTPEGQRWLWVVTEPQFWATGPAVIQPDAVANDLHRVAELLYDRSTAAINPALHTEIDPPIIPATDGLTKLTVLFR